VAETLGGIYSVSDTINPEHFFGSDGVECELEQRAIVGARLWSALRAEFFYES